jgi:hypothetical protein
MDLRSHYVGHLDWKKRFGLQQQHMAWGQVPKCYVGIVDWLWEAWMATCVVANS